jgi:hypothetical protein
MMYDSPSFWRTPTLVNSNSFIGLAGHKKAAKWRLMRVRSLLLDLIRFGGAPSRY